MDRISCNIIQDILPLYIDDVVSDDTREMVEEHLAGCENCTERFRAMRREEEWSKAISAAEAEKQAVVKAKKKIRKKRIVTAILSLIAGAIVIVMAYKVMNLVKIPVPYEKDRFEVTVREEGGEDCLYLNYTGRMYNYEQVEVTDVDTNQSVMYLELYTTLWQDLFDHEGPSRREIFMGTIHLGNEVVELRYIEGDIRQFYEPTRDYVNLEKNSILLWESEDTDTAGKQSK